MLLILRAIDRLSFFALICAGLILVYAVSHILLETVMRSLFDKSTHVLDEFIGFAVLSITFLSLSWSLRDGAMIQVNLITNRLSSKTQNILQSLTALVATGLGAYFWTFLLRNMMKNWKRGAVSESVAEVPLWIPDLIVLIGAGLLVLQLAATSVRPFMAADMEN